jgi:hypothetical protein
MNTWYGRALFTAVAFASACAQGLTIQDAKIVQDPSGHAPLTALLTFTTDAPATATLVIESAGRETITHTFAGKPGTAHSLMVLGMVSNAKHTVHAELKDAGGVAAKTQVFDIQTPPLPEEFPPLSVSTARPKRMEPGVTMIPLMRWPPGAEPDAKFGLLVAVNAQGEIVWYYKPDHQVFDPVALLDGNFAYLSDRNAGVLYEVDMLGQVVRQWHSSGIPKEVPATSIPIAADTFHHTFEQMPNGDFLLLSTEVRHFDAFPSSETVAPSPTAPADVIGDIIMEAAPDGKIVRQFKLFDLINPMRIGFDSLGTGFYQHAYEKVLKTPGKDWSHTNSVFYDPATDSAILSSRHLDFVYKINMKTGQLAWILGNHDDWTEAEQKLLLTPKGDHFAWQYHQHAAKLTPQGTILLFDNGNYRARPGQTRQTPEESYSRVVEFKVDEAAMTVEQVWSYGEAPADRFHSPFICDVDWLPKSGNVLVTDGGRVKDKDGKPSVNIFAGHHWVRIIELTHDTTPAKVWEMVIDDPRVGWAVFRAERVPSLYR